MNKDIRVATSFRGHRKRKRLVRELGVGAEIYLLDLWLSVSLDCPNGILTGWDEIDIADAAGWVGDPNIFVSALINTVWIEKDSDGEYIIHDWCEHQGWACKAQERSNAAKKAADARWSKKNAGSNAGLCGAHTGGNAPSPKPLPSPLPIKKDLPDPDGPVAPKPESEFYMTKKKRKLSGKRLQTFNTFWECFNFKNGKADAADSWLDIPQLTDSLCEIIFTKAKTEAKNRNNSDKSPKWAQGWLTSRRWEDETILTPTNKSKNEIEHDKFTGDNYYGKSSTDGKDNPVF